jgi:hypothetical protein
MLEQVDQDLLLQDFGLSVTAGAVSGLGILDRHSDVILDGQIVTVNYSLIVRTDQFGDLNYGDTITVSTDSYKVEHEPLRIADGMYSVVVLELLAAPPVEFVYLVTLDGITLATQNERKLVTL